MGLGGVVAQACRAIIEAGYDGGGDVDAENLIDEGGKGLVYASY